MDEENNLIWFKEEVSTPDNLKITLFFTKFENAIIVFLTDKDIKIGTIAIAVPTKINSINKINSSIIPFMFGVKNELITRAIAEKVSKQTNRLSIIITNLVSDSKDYYSSLFGVIGKMLSKLNY